MYKHIKKYVRDLMHPYIAAFKDIVDKSFQYLNQRLNEIYSRLNLLISQLRTSLDQVRTVLMNRTNALELHYNEEYADYNLQVDDHIRNYDNPHNVNASQLGTVSAVQPDPSQGAVGDTWFQYEPNYTVPNT